jgi:hypothetical protein
VRNNQVSACSVQIAFPFLALEFMNLMVGDSLLKSTQSYHVFHLLMKNDSPSGVKSMAMISSLILFRRKGSIFLENVS